ncbi:uncharacterized protein LOC128736857 [Sabethes cyaneus]|uniref:uncharacterized protein LOC128736857 n=1 Tax=Sabethes cyaneus TaxID=53552 RepID=UPI00237DE31C|nr:uncharacterized protein LOC128736857 [Sabethes cyaneus]
MAGGAERFVLGTSVNKSQVRPRVAPNLSVGLRAVKMFNQPTQHVLIAALVCLVYGTSEFPEYTKFPPTPLVCITSGCIIGKNRDGLEGNQYEAYFGIPYAKPPLGKLRFRDPVPVESWVGYYDATYERSKCMQKINSHPLSQVEGSEDCLYLNLYRPKYIMDPLPVIVYIHGGSYASGSASVAEYGPERLMNTRKVIVVVLQYRLGAFGFLSTEDDCAPGNYGLKDQSLALRWVQQNIQKFGGDSKRVTLVGQSAGGAAVQLHMMSPLSRGTFSKAISMSGSAIGYWNYNIDQARVARRQAAVLGIPDAYTIPATQLIDQLRAVDAIELAKSIDRLKYFYVHPTALYQPVVERHVTNATFMPREPRALWATGKFEKVPWVTGFLPNDGAADSLGIVSNVTLLEQLNEKSRIYIPRLAGGDAGPRSTQMLKERFFNDSASREHWLTKDNFLNIQNLLTESTMHYPIILGVKQHTALKSSKRAPVGVYYFNFKGRHSNSYLYTYTREDFGVCHADELLYLFRNTALAPDFATGSPEYVMAKAFVDYIVKTAYEGVVGPTCERDDCQLLEFVNSDDTKAPVELNLYNGFDEEMFQFWRKFYRLQGIYSPPERHVQVALLGPILLVCCSASDDTIRPNGPRTCLADGGCLQGRYFSSQKGTRYEAYLGVPYARPPIGELRFKNPQPLEPWTGVYNATYERDKCVQKNDLWPNAAVEGSEDCLYMNIYKPEFPKNPDRPLAVMVYIHGGGYFAGSASKGEFGPDRFMDNGEVIIVVMQYRLGVFGFLSTGDQVATGNYGLKDQSAVLKWVQKNIAQFEGDPTLVTLFGQSAGGSSVQMHMMSDLSKGLFSRAVIMSGSALGFWHQPVDNPLEFAQQQATAVGIQSASTMSSEELVQALRQVDALELGGSIDKLKFWHIFPLVVYRPVVEKHVDDGTFISQDPRTLWATGAYHQIPWRIGYVPNEGAFASLALITNTSLIADLNKHADSYIPRMFGVKEDDKSRRMLRQRFFPDGTDQDWITVANYANLQHLFSEAFITYPVALSVKQHIASTVKNKSPIDVYYFSFKGDHSHSKYFSQTDTDFGVCHSDDLSYLYRSKDLFEDFEPNSSELAMATQLVDYYVKFAYDGVTNESCKQDCDILEFTNSNDPNKPVETRTKKGFDEQMVAFWSEIYDWS